MMWLIYKYTFFSHSDPRNFSIHQADLSTGYWNTDYYLIFVKEPFNNLQSIIQSQTVPIKQVCMQKSRAVISL